jgi:hypothetical protein
MDRLYADFMERLGAKTIRNVHGTVSRALRDAWLGGGAWANVVTPANDRLVKALLKEVPTLALQSRRRHRRVDEGQVLDHMARHPIHLRYDAA